MTFASAEATVDCAFAVTVDAGAGCAHAVADAAPQRTTSTSSHRHMAGTSISSVRATLKYLVTGTRSTTSTRSVALTPQFFEAARKLAATRDNAARPSPSWRLPRPARSRVVPRPGNRDRLRRRE